MDTLLNMNNFIKYIIEYVNHNLTSTHSHIFLNNWSGANAVSIEKYKREQIK